LASALKPGDLIALEGDLGSGKTVLVQGIAQGLEVSDAVHSPTFVLHHRYAGRITLDHFDLYRLGGLEWVDTGLDEPAPEAVTVVEWSERAGALSGWATIRIRLEADGPSARVITLLKGTSSVEACFDGTAPARA
jgi:tRNA threonylcarbamoyl adenosine modification protein YjeE